MDNTEPNNQEQEQKEAKQQLVYRPTKVLSCSVCDMIAIGTTAFIVAVLAIAGATLGGIALHYNQLCAREDYPHVEENEKTIEFDNIEEQLEKLNILSPIETRVYSDKSLNNTIVVKLIKKSIQKSTLDSLKLNINSFNDSTVYTIQAQIPDYSFPLCYFADLDIYLPPSISNTKIYVRTFGHDFLWNTKENADSSLRANITISEMRLDGGNHLVRFESTQCFGQFIIANRKGDVEIENVLAGFGLVTTDGAIRYKDLVTPCGVWALNSAESSIEGSTLVGKIPQVPFCQEPGQFSFTTADQNHQKHATFVQVGFLEALTDYGDISINLDSPRYRAEVQVSTEKEPEFEDSVDQVYQRENAYLNTTSDFDNEDFKPDYIYTIGIPEDKTAESASLSKLIKIRSGSGQVTIKNENE